MNNKDDIKTYSPEYTNGSFNLNISEPTQKTPSKLTQKSADDSLLSPSNFEHAYRMANMICKTEMVPKAYQNKPQDVLVAMEMGRTLGLSPLSAVQNIAVINGRPTLYGDAILAVCSGHPDFENIEECPILEGEKVIGYTCRVKRRGRGVTSQTFTIEQATNAGLWGKIGPWKSYPQRMLQMRARAFALRDSFADALGGVRVTEEVQDYEIKNVTPQKEASDNAKAELMSFINTNSKKQEPIRNSLENVASSADGE